MNNQGAETTDYTGTIYVIRVVGTDLQSRIDALPKPEDITYDNYQRYVEMVEQLRRDYDKLSETERQKINATKLIEAEKRIKYFQAVTAVVKLLGEIPAVNNLKENNALSIQKQVRAAYAAYAVLDEDQKACIVL